MSYLFINKAPMQSIFWPKKNSRLKQVLLVLSGVLLLAFASQLSIPLRPIPLTFQSVTVVLIGMAYGARYGTYVVAAYLLAGILGIPVFADYSDGIAKLYGPTAGYLIGFLPAVLLSGYLAQKGWAKTIAGSFAAACLGVGVIFFCGVTVLAQFIGLHNAIAFGVMPFVVAEPIKLIAAACIIPRFWKKR